MKKLSEYEKEFWSKFNIAYIHDKGFAGLGLEINQFYHQAIKEILEEVVGLDCACQDDESPLWIHGYDTAKAEIRERIAKIIK